MPVRRIVPYSIYSSQSIHILWQCVLPAYKLRMEAMGLHTSYLEVLKVSLSVWFYDNKFAFYFILFFLIYLMLYVFLQLIVFVYAG